MKQMQMTEKTALLICKAAIIFGNTFARVRNPTGTGARHAIVEVVREAFTIVGGLADRMADGADGDVKSEIYGATGNVAEMFSNAITQLLNAVDAGERNVTSDVIKEAVTFVGGLAHRMASATDTSARFKIAGAIYHAAHILCNVIVLLPNSSDINLKNAIL